MNKKVLKICNHFYKSDLSVTKSTIKHQLVFFNQQTLPWMLINKECLPHMFYLTSKLKALSVIVHFKLRFYIWTPPIFCAIPQNINLPTCRTVFLSANTSVDAQECLPHMFYLTSKLKELSVIAHFKLRFYLNPQIFLQNHEHLIPAKLHSPIY